MLFHLRIDFVEIGFGHKNNEYLGPLAYCTEDFYAILNSKNSTKLGVMISSSEIKSHKNILEIMPRLFPIEASYSSIFSQNSNYFRGSRICSQSRKVA